MRAGVVDHVVAIVDSEDSDFKIFGDHLVALTLHHVRGRADVNHHVVVYTGADFVTSTNQRRESSANR
jgi:hypothetical protein